MFHEGSASKNVSHRDEEPRPRRGGIQKHGLAEAEHQATRQGKDGSKLRETLIQNITRLLKRFPRIRELMESSQPENKTLLRVSRLHSGTL